jgi:potassium inwardly-rectifying channel subfamily J
VHKIDSESPFYEMSARDFLKKQYEIVVILEGVIEQTGNTIQVGDDGALVLTPTQARSSYLPNEVLWGHRFVNLLNFKHSEAEYKIDYSSFHSVYQ